ncbi:MAG: TMEM175 family protein [Chloroflexota bacterium]
MTSHVDGIADANPEAGRLGFDRVVFFSDAVFAIAMTLLVVDLRLPELVSYADADIAAALWGVRWDIFAYVLSFLVIGSFCRALAAIPSHQRIDGRHATINVLFLGAIAFIPFPTSVLGSAGDTPVPVAFYGVCVSIAAGLGLLETWDGWRRGLYAPTVTRATVRTWLLAGCVVPCVMLGSLLLLPFVGATLVELSWVTAARSLAGSGHGGT